MLITADSGMTSWTTDIEVAKNFALRPNGEGVLLRKVIDNTSTVRSPNTKTVNLKQSPGTLKSESEVLVRGKIKNAVVTKVKQ